MHPTAKAKTLLESVCIGAGSERKFVSQWPLLTALTDIQMCRSFDLKCCMCVLSCLWNI